MIVSYTHFMLFYYPLHALLTMHFELESDAGDDKIVCTFERFYSWLLQYLEIVKIIWHNSALYM